MAIVSTSDFWSDNYQFKIGRSQLRRKLRRLTQTLAAQKDAELFETLSGAAVGAAASRTTKFIAHNQAPGAPAPTGAISTRTHVSANTAAADETALDLIFSTTSFSRPSTYAADLSGNGGGSKVQGS